MSKFGAVLLGDYFALVFSDIPVLCFFNPYAIASFNGRIISTSNLEVLGPAKTEIQTIARMFENRFPFHLRAQSDNCLPCSRDLVMICLD